MKNEDLLRITYDDNGIGTMCRLDADTIAYLCLSLAKLIKEHPAFAEGINKALELLEDEDFDNELEKNTINIKNADFLS